MNVKLQSQRGRPGAPGGRFHRRRAPLPADPEKLSRDEKRRLLAKVVRLNPAECFDKSGAVDLERVRQMPGALFQQMTVHETTRTDRQGNTTVKRRVTVRLVDKVRALRLDDQFEEREEADQPEIISEEEKKHLETVEKMAKNDVFFEWKAPPGFPHASPPWGDVDEDLGDEGDPLKARPPP